MIQKRYKSAMLVLKFSIQLIQLTKKFFCYLYFLKIKKKYFL